MEFKPIVKTEIELIDTPDNFHATVLKELEDELSKLIKVVKIIQYPYKDKAKEMIIYKAYIVRFNLMILVSQYGEDNRTDIDKMVAADCIEFTNYWKSNYLNVN